MIDTSKSEFYHFGILPPVCIHSPIEDEYSKSYIPRDKCDCGHVGEWIISEMKMFENSMRYVFPTKTVHRCKNCNSVRMADHIAKDNL